MTEFMVGPGSVGARPEDGFTVRSRFDDPRHVVRMGGELDLDSRAAALEACASVGHRDVLVDLSGLTFMDCAGYGALVDARTILERRGGSLEWTNAVGVPARLLALIEQLERRPLEPCPNCARSMGRAAPAPARPAGPPGAGG